MDMRYVYLHPLAGAGHDTMSNVFRLLLSNPCVSAKTFHYLESFGLTIILLVTHRRRHRHDPQQHCAQQRAAEIGLHCWDNLAPASPPVTPLPVSNVQGNDAPMPKIASTVLPADAGPAWLAVVQRARQLDSISTTYLRQAYAPALQPLAADQQQVLSCMHPATMIC